MDYQVGHMDLLIVKIWCLKDLCLKERTIVKNWTPPLLNMIRDYVVKYVNIRLMNITKFEEHILIAEYINPQLSVYPSHVDEAKPQQFQYKWFKQHYQFEYSIAKDLTFVYLISFLIMTHKRLLLLTGLKLEEGQWTTICIS